VNYLLLPATVALAIPLYEKLDLLKANAAAIIAGISVGTLVSLGSALALALALHLTQEQYATLLPKSVTTAISMDVAAELGGIAALTGAIVILTGIVGNLLAETVCKRSTSPTPLPRVWASAPRPMPWAPARLCRWVRWKVP
jgi:LrgB-like family